MNEIELTPKQIVAELNKYIVGQGEAKKSVAIALRNRWRRKRLSEDMQNEIIPKNILLIGPTGVGKTEIARRLAADAVPDRKDPFVYCGVCPDLCVYAAGVLLSAVVCALLRGAGRGWRPVDGRRPAGTAPHSGALM